MSDKLEILTKEARSLIQRGFKTYHPAYGFSTTSCQVYDTAWVAMITKDGDGEKKWLFPESFQYLLRAQADDGSWGRHPSTKTVAVLDTAAALLALLHHAKEPLQLQDISPTEIRQRINRAAESLRVQLTAWDDISVTNHIGVELIVPALLSYLASEDESLDFEFAGREVLMSMHKAKLAHFNPDCLYRKRPSSALHSLEAFVSKIDFDRIGHHLFKGSMLASPSSTAAYLIHASTWNDEAEAYLQHVCVAGAGHGDGGIPGTYPTSYFEYNWVLSTLLRAGFSRSDLECNELSGIAKIIIDGFEEDHGVIGFAPRAVDVDDTAKGLLTLRLLNMDEAVSPAVMITTFEAEDHFRTFGAERDPSFTSNCHVLIALLHQSDRERYLPQIKKATRFLCRFWWDCDGLVKDKWHLSHLYPTMLLVQAFADLIRLAEDAAGRDVFDAELLSKVSICLFQASLRTILSQETDGSWKGQPEETSYAILTLAEAARLVFFKDLQPQIRSAISRGSVFLESNHRKVSEYNWTSKTAYRATFVAEAYLLAAARVALDPMAGLAADVGNSLGLSRLSSRMEDYSQIVRQTELFSSMAPWELQASFVEAALFVPLLRAHRLKVYDRDQMIGIGKDSYIDIIPFTWVGCNNRSRTFVAASILFDMMVLSMLGYQTDEFIEVSAAPVFAQNTAELHILVDKVVDMSTDALASVVEAYGDDASFVHVEIGETPGNGAIEGHASDALQHKNAIIECTKRASARDYGQVEAALQRFAYYVLGHQRVTKASLQDQMELRNELRAYLHAHATQVEDNAQLVLKTPRSDSLSGHKSDRSFFDWVRTTAADHVACVYSFTFACCLFSALIGQGRDLFPTVKEKYLVHAAARHMATMCRMCNDFGSLDRDLTEGNVNSVNFPEFASISSFTGKKKALAELAEYERHCLRHTLEHLEAETLQSTKPPNAPGGFNKRKTEIVRYYADVTDFYDQLYLVRDLSSSISESARD